MFIKYHDKIYKTLMLIGMVALPVLALNFVYSSVSLVNSILPADPPSDPVLVKMNLHRHSQASRILIMVFDEMDHRIAFEERPAGLKMPALDRLRHEALYATHAFPPAKFTHLSVPAITTGKLFSDAQVTTDGRVRLVQRESKESLLWQDQENIFSTAHARGLNVALFGVYLPYVQTFGPFLALARQFEGRYRTEALPEVMFGQFRKLVETMPLSGHLGLVNRMYLSVELAKHIRRYQEFLEEIKSAAANPDLDVIYVHLPAPHTPFIYDRLTDNFSLKNGDYYDNLALVDRTLREVRQAMEAAGLWDQTHILITSDHWWRSPTFFVTRSDHRVPFLLKLAGQKTGVTYDRPFNTVLLRDLLSFLLSPEPKNQDQVIDWLNRHRSFGESPLTTDVLG